MAFTKVLPSGISSTATVVFDSINTVGVITASSIVATTGTFSGNVGIGTDNPQSALDVFDISRIKQVVSGNTNQIEFFKDATPTFAASVGLSVPAVGSINDALVFTTYSGSWNERLRITSGGDVNVAAGGSVFISNGNLVFSTSGTGIDFSATSNSSGTTTSELLSDYEEGTWTPTLFSGATGGSYSTRNGGYVRVGNLVYASLDITGSGWTANGNHLKFGGLPFASAVVDNLTFGGAFVNYGNMIDQNTLSNCQFHISWNGSTTIDVYNNTAAVNGNTSGVSVNARIILSIVYRTS